MLLGRLDETNACVCMHVYKIAANSIKIIFMRKYFKRICHDNFSVQKCNQLNASSSAKHFVYSKIACEEILQFYGTKDVSIWINDNTFMLEHFGLSYWPTALSRKIRKNIKSSNGLHNDFADLILRPSFNTGCKVVQNQRKSIFVFFLQRFHLNVIIFYLFLHLCDWWRLTYILKLFTTQSANYSVEIISSLNLQLFNNKSWWLPHRSSKTFTGCLLIIEIKSNVLDFQRKSNIKYDSYYRQTNL